jgi:predicted MFS family arabinose efflux permease
MIRPNSFAGEIRVKVSIVGPVLFLHLPPKLSWFPWIASERIKLIASEVLIFALGLALPGVSICGIVVDPARAARRRYEEFKEAGLRSSMFSGATVALAFGVLAFAAFLRADLHLVWAVLAIVSILSAALVMIVATFTPGSQSIRYPEISDEALTALTRKAIWRAALLAMWVYSWRHLFMPS